MSIIQGVVKEKEIETTSQTSGKIRTNLLDDGVSGDIKTNIDTKVKVLVDDEYVIFENKDILFSIGDYIIVYGHMGQNMFYGQYYHNVTKNKTIKPEKSIALLVISLFIAVALLSNYFHDKYSGVISENGLFAEIGGYLFDKNGYFFNIVSYILCNYDLIIRNNICDNFIFGIYVKL